MIDVTILFLQGGHFSTAVIPMEIFRAAGVLWNLFYNEKQKSQFKVTTASANGKQMRIEALLRVAPIASIDEVKKTDLIIVPASGLEFDVLTKCGFDIDSAVARNATIIPWLQKMADRGTEIAGVCSGVALLGAAGLIDGRRATSHWALADALKVRYPKVDWQFQHLVTDDNGVYCGGGVNSASDLSLYLIEKFCGREVAAKTAQSLVIEMPRVWQIPFAGLLNEKRHEDDAILKAQDWLRTNFKREIRFEALAKRVGMSPRNFARRFKQATGQSPIAYLQGLRIAQAKRLLSDQHHSIQDVSEAVGYDDMLFFRSLFRRHVGVTPSEYRLRFGNGRLEAAE
jgi:transcriptional regulator GlxA family with amidase domain